MLMGIVAVAVVGFASVFTLLRRKNQGSANVGEAGAQSVKLGRLY
jgi:hypothetical protein